MDPSFLQLSRIVHQERLQTAATEQRFNKAATAGSHLRKRILSSLGNGLIFIGQQLTIGQQEEPIKSISPSTGQTGN